MAMNVRNNLLAALLIGGLAVAPFATSFATSSVTPDVSIPFANHGGIRDWQADKDRGLWVQDVHRKWYYASLMAPCTGLSFAQTIGFDTRPMGSFDRWSAIIVPRYGRCIVQNFTPSDGPPRKQKMASAPESEPKS
jgi:Family of unknown function (DUF6491)